MGCASLPIACLLLHTKALIQHTASKDVMVRLRVLRTLSQLNVEQREQLFSQYPEAASALLLRLEDVDALVRRAALTILRGLWPATCKLTHKEIFVTIRRMLSDKDECVRRAAGRLLDSEEVDT